MDGHSVKKKKERTKTGIDYLHGTFSYFLFFSHSRSLSFPPMRVLQGSATRNRNKEAEMQDSRRDVECRGNCRQIHFIPPMRRPNRAEIQHTAGRSRPSKFGVVICQNLFLDFNKTGGGWVCSPNGPFPCKPHQSHRRHGYHPTFSIDR